MRLVLTGFMGTGKTSAGRRVAQILGRPFADTDERVEAAAGRPIREIFARCGERRFRELERQAIAEALELPEAVVSVGGGAIGSEETFGRLARAGLLVCLRASPEAIAERVGPTVADRPLLAGAPSLPERIRSLLAARAADYARVREQVETTGLSVDEVAAELIARLRRAEGLR